jgi:hypothetical protein
VSSKLDGCSTLEKRERYSNMKALRIFLVAALLAVPMLVASVAFTQEESFDSREQNFRAYVTLMRADIKAQRRDIITAIMQFSDTDAAKFWPIFQQYDGRANDDRRRPHAAHRGLEFRLQQPVCLPARK